MAWLATQWHIRAETRTAIRDHHCAPFPEDIPHRLIKLLTYRRDVVVDPMSGSGTTTAVAAGLGRRYIGIDRSPAYCAFARHRTEEAALRAKEGNVASEIASPAAPPAQLSLELDREVNP